MKKGVFALNAVENFVYSHAEEWYYILISYLLKDQLQIDYGHKCKTQNHETI